MCRTSCYLVAGAGSPMGKNRLRSGCLIAFSEVWVGSLSSHGVLRQVRRTIPWLDTYPIRLPDAPSSHIDLDTRELFRVNNRIGYPENPP
jgi:hypothetical protein